MSVKEYKNNSVWIYCDIQNNKYKMYYKNLLIFRQISLVRDAEQVCPL